jgi:hypothetical protein
MDALTCSATTLLPWLVRDAPSFDAFRQASANGASPVR